MLYQNEIGFLFLMSIFVYLHETAKQIYHRISYPVKRPFSQENFRWKLVNQNILPNYLKTFNYRTVRNLLPFSLDSGECALCLQFQDTAVHVFAKCSITR